MNKGNLEKEGNGMKAESFLMAMVLAATICFGGCVPHKAAETVRDAGQLETSPKIAEYLRSGHYVQALHRIGMYWQQKHHVDTECPEEAFIKPGQVVVLQPIVHRKGDAYPQSGAWQQRFEFARCGQKKTCNAIFLATPSAPPQVQPLPPGDTIASLQLLHDARQAAMMAAYLKLGPQEEGKKCRDMEIVDTKLISPPPMGLLPKSGPWVEEWTIDCCGKPVAVTADFAPNGRGGTSFHFK
jgi:hypothetical protein